MSVAFLATGCTDPKSRFQDFENAFPDAGPPPDAMVQVPDAAPRDVPDPTGTYYVSFVTAGFGDSDEFITNLIWTITATKNTEGQPVSLDMTTQTLTLIANGRQPIGTPITKTNQPISSGGEFQLQFDNFELQPEASLIGTTVILSAKFDTTIQTADVFCGVIKEGNVITPIAQSLVGSTFVGVRVPPGTVGDNLPPPTKACPPPPMPDGGLPDGGPTDAALPDAALPDAA